MKYQSIIYSSKYILRKEILTEEKLILKRNAKIFENLISKKKFKNDNIKTML